MRGRACARKGRQRCPPVSFLLAATIAAICAALNLLVRSMFRKPSHSFCRGGREGEGEAGVGWAAARAGAEAGAAERAPSAPDARAHLDVGDLRVDGHADAWGVAVQRDVARHLHVEIRFFLGGLGPEVRAALVRRPLLARDEGADAAELADHRVLRRARRRAARPRVGMDVVDVRDMQIVARAPAVGVDQTVRVVRLNELRRRSDVENALAVSCR